MPEYPDITLYLERLAPRVLGRRLERTGGKLLADRARSRLLKQDWPRTLEELEELRQR